MDNELISVETSKKIIEDMNNLIESGRKGKIMLNDYMGDNLDACFDFAMVYEASDVLRNYINTQRTQGVNIDVQEDNISIL